MSKPDRCRTEHRGKISLNEAAAKGIERVRKPHWSNSFDHFKIDIIDGKPGPWLHLYAPFNKECNGRDPVDIVWSAVFVGANGNAFEFFQYTGPLPDSDEYRAAVAQYDGCLRNEAAE